MKSYEEHRHAAPKTVKVSVITVSTSRYQALKRGEEVSDPSGSKAKRMIEDAGQEVVSTKLVNDDVGMIRLELLKSIYEDKADAVILTGGTGVTGRDVTVESVRPLLDKELEGFGDIFRSVSYSQIGSPAHLSRALAGVIDRRVVYCLPGSPGAVETALNIILPELPHAVYMARS